MTSRRDYILGAVRDLAAGFLYYDRKEDEELPPGAIEEAINAGEVTADEITGVFTAAILDGLDDD